MKLHSFALRAFAFAALVTILLSPCTYAGLYGDDGKTQTAGELNSQDYWWSRYDLMMLDIALQQHQPEGRIGINLAIAGRRLDELAEKYPQHEEIKKMKARVDELAAKIDPNANRSDQFNKECPWDESNFAQLWVNLHWAQVAYQQKDYKTAVSCLQNVEQNYTIMLAPGRMKNYPEELSKWVTENKSVADKLYAQGKQKL